MQLQGILLMGSQVALRTQQTFASQQQNEISWDTWIINVYLPKFPSQPL